MIASFSLKGGTNGKCLATKHPQALHADGEESGQTVKTCFINEQHISTVNSTLINDQNDPQTIKNGIGKLWKATEAIKRKFEFPANLSKVDALQREIDEYKLKCAEDEEKIQELQQEIASLMEAI